MKARLVKARGFPYGEWSCEDCGNKFIDSPDHAGQSSRCFQCFHDSVMPPVACYYGPDCGGTYGRCDGLIQKLPPDELSAAEAVAFEDVDWENARPTDEWREYIRDINGSILTYRCTTCGETYTARYGNSNGFYSGSSTCEVVRCSDCRRVPPLAELPERDA